MHISWTADRSGLPAAAGRSRSAEMSSSRVRWLTGVWHTAEPAPSQAPPGGAWLTFAPTVQALLDQGEATRGLRRAPLSATFHTGPQGDGQ